MRKPRKSSRLEFFRRLLHLRASRTDGFASPVTPTQAQLVQPEQSSLSLVLPNISLELAQSWQFLWRTALEPRAPSFLS